MATIRRYEVVWSGISALPGLSVFYSDAATAAGADIKAFFTAIKGFFPSSLTWNVPTSGDEISDATGQLVGGWTDAGGGTVTSSGVGAYAAGTGGFVTWQTGTIVSGRRLKGRTFLVPLLHDSYDSGGNVTSGTRTTLQTAATALVTAGTTKIFHRPTSIGAANGTSSVLSGATVSPQVTSLRSRRV
jgi:hypothetical protein